MGENQLFYSKRKCYIYRSNRVKYLYVVDLLIFDSFVPHNLHVKGFVAVESVMNFTCVYIIQYIWR